QAPTQRPDTQLRGCAVVGENQNRVEIGSLQEHVVAGQRLHAAMLARQPLAQPRIRIRRGHRLPQLVPAERGKIAPHMIVIEPENSHSQPSHGSSPHLVRAFRPSSSIAVTTEAYRDPWLPRKGVMDTRSP